MNRKTSILGIVITVSILFLSSGMVSAIDYEYSYDDETGDVKQTPGMEDTVDEPAIDITHIKTTEDGNNVTFQIKVDGEIKESTDSTEYNYYFHVVNEASAEAIGQDTFLLTYDGDENATYYVDSDSNSINTTVEGDTLTMKVPKSAFSDLDGFHLAPRTTKAVDEQDEGATDSAFSWDDGSSEDGENGDTPGFEVITMLAALSITVGIYGYTRKNKR